MLVQLEGELWELSWVETNEMTFVVLSWFSVGSWDRYKVIKYTRCQRKDVFKTERILLTKEKKSQPISLYKKKR